MSAVPRQLEREDALVYLNRKPAQEYKKGSIIFDKEHPSPGLYVVLDGAVLVNYEDSHGAMVSDIYSADDLFGECGLLNVQYSGFAIAAEDCTVMCWTRDELDEQISQRPQLAIALVQAFVERCVGLSERMQSMALARTPERVALGLLHFADRLGNPEEDGARKMPALTHSTIASYVGTSREIVTVQMNRLRQHGFLKYSRKAIEVYRDALAEDLRNKYPAIRNLV